MFEENENLENQSILHAVEDVDIENLLRHFACSSYVTSSADEFSTKALEKCIQLMKRDYEISIINNSEGALCDHYPAKIVIFENKKKSGSAPTIYESECSETALHRMIWDARFARCRTRFPVPVINYKGKNICRSSTLSGGPEIYTRTGLSFMFGSSMQCKLPPQPPIDATDAELNPNRKWKEIEEALYERVRCYDINLLNKIRVGTIVDLMVENKKVKFGMYVTSSEKSDSERRYNSFKTVGLPYPGCEFFKDFSDNNFSAENLVYDWAQDFIDAPINVPEDHMSKQLNIEWADYQHWDLVKITQNYLKLILKYIQESSTGILIHCISGWDRTPLFISLVRISLWADGLIHKSLDAKQILYLTLAYDWYLFGHQLENRLAKGENIMLFCFYILKYITGDDFNIPPPNTTTTTNNSRSKKTEPGTSTAVSDFESTILLDNESRGSNVSINSTCSSISTKSQDQFCNIISEDSNNGNSPPHQSSALESSKSPHNKRTSPVAVPNSARLRQRHDSTTSLGSWQFITNAGSLRTEKLQFSERARKINAVRDAFYKAYPKGVGFEPKTSFYTGMLGKVAHITSFMYLKNKTSKA